MFKLKLNQIGWIVVIIVGVFWIIFTVGRKMNVYDECETSVYSLKGILSEDLFRDSLKGCFKEAFLG